MVFLCCSAYPTPSRSSLCLDAFTVALNQACDRQEWYTSTTELQLASLSFCVACRNVTTLRLIIDDYILPRLMIAADELLPHPGEPGWTRVPRLRARSVLWNRQLSVELVEPLYSLADVEMFEFGRGFEDDFEGVVWPCRLRLLKTGYNFDWGITRVTWPQSLRKITFGDCFNQSLWSLSWPPSLLEIKFGADFNQPSWNFSWPPSLEQITFGAGFSQHIHDAPWPPALQKLIFGECFNGITEGVAWPASLGQLTFGFCFNQPVELVTWPASLRQLEFGPDFNQSIASVVWPAGLQRLEFGDSFNQPVSQVVWPASLQELSLGCVSLRDEGFNQAIDKAVWPPSLRRLKLGSSFKQSLHGLGTWMPNLAELKLLVEDLSVLIGVEWPKFLQQLKIRPSARNRDGTTMPPTVEVCCSEEY